MRQPVKTTTADEFMMVHVPVRQALDEAYAGIGPKPPYDDRVYEAAIRAGATDEWRIMIAGKIHLIYATEAEADAAMDNIKTEMDAEIAWMNGDE